MRTALPEQTRAAATPGGSAVTSVAVLLLVLAPAVVIVAGAEARPQGSASIRQEAGAGGALQPAGASARTAEPGQSGQAQVRPDLAGDTGLGLLREAAVAGRTLPYQGVQIVSWWSPSGSTTMVVKLAHQPGQGTLLRTADTGSGAGREDFVADEAGAQPGGVLGITEETLDLLAWNYQVIAAGNGSACGRPAAIVEARRGNGTLAARFWLDNATKIPLRRELFDDQSRMINENVFIDLDLSRSAAAGSMRARPAAAPHPWGLLTPADLARLRAGGWPVPSHLPGRLALFRAWRAATPAGPVFQLGYSDGLSGLSLFVQRGSLPRKLTGWREISVSGSSVYALDPAPQRLTWSSHGHVITLIADAPAVTIGAVVGALPHDARQGLWARMCHGFGRVIAWVNPFR